MLKLIAFIFSFSLVPVLVGISVTNLCVTVLCAVGNAEIYLLPCVYHRFVLLLIICCSFYGMSPEHLLGLLDDSSVHAATFPCYCWKRDVK